MPNSARPPANRPGLLIVDDDPLIADSLSFLLEADFDVVSHASRGAAIGWLREQASPPALALIDLGLPPNPHRPDEGYALIADLLAHSPDTRIVVLSGQGEEKVARHARALGATEFVAKPAQPQALNTLLRQLARTCGEECALALPALIGVSAQMERLRAQIEQYASLPYPVLIEGESGTGKDIVANRLHAVVGGGRPFLALNCAAISPSLVEPTLFGHARGAFTGAQTARAGYFEEAAAGTLFLDEIGELPLDLQAKLLRVLENGEFQRVGETQLRRSNARIVAATNRDLGAEVRAGRFRSDLYHRLSVFTIALPPLRDMGDDRLRLLDHFRSQFCAQLARPPFALDAAARTAWLDYGFPGNVRELRNIVIRLATKYPGQEVGREALLAEFDPTIRSGAAAGQDGDLIDIAIAELRSGGFRLDAKLREWESAYIDAAMRLARGNVSAAARLLGIARTTLYHRMEAPDGDAGGQD
ncbi:sigma-54-dependent transcriptional regulator [Methyloversatilis discipulorum]|uniref:sigma-54-dependent transcriptional regulator n=1 Tax=Methyloversatilis discipulorum TaxID=1119528 RepID=UPI001A545F9D|nr:sigma-54 dependent transcriptional regulator [Methyloversatilis discipulorum]MBL8468116.1 sigma-54-dependent Fis family transcriptional regulator [Methyloversatilis discipulorum]